MVPASVGLAPSIRFTFSAPGISGSDSRYSTSVSASGAGNADAGCSGGAVVSVVDATWAAGSAGSWPPQPDRASTAATTVLKEMRCQYIQPSSVRRGHLGQRHQ